MFYPSCDIFCFEKLICIWYIVSDIYIYILYITIWYLWLYRLSQQIHDQVASLNGLGEKLSVGGVEVLSQCISRTWKTRAYSLGYCRLSEWCVSWQTADSPRDPSFYPGGFLRLSLHVWNLWCITYHMIYELTFLTTAFPAHFVSNYQYLLHCQEIFNLLPNVLAPEISEALNEATADNMTMIYISSIFKFGSCMAIIRWHMGMNECWLL